ncbi:linear amide C-N hydrolase [Tropicimonas sp. IMCC34043]|uniref:linear amide C-N hydrolase n=1 Tax=Tropicimonas sp. IMCC34043 TaxID=2248760 RepID=UPI000E259A59|nr:linear amide C-N hydrolase [Tropicimonas sp. IMCC34043]
MCSRIQWKADGQPVIVGRNMDWTARMGTKLMAMPRGIERDGLTDVNPLQWTSKYGSVVSAVWDCATADGLNDAGLNVNLLYLAESKYGERDPSRPGLSVALWVQYFLDTCATVAEAVEAAKSFQIQPIELIHKGEKADAPVHLSFSDPSGDSAIVEVLDGETQIHHGPQYNVMTNSPPFDEQLVLLKQYEGLGGKKPIPGTMEAEDRFARGAFYLTKLPDDPGSYQAAVAGVLSVIRNMATPFGANDPVRPNISATIWRSISDCTNKRYYFEFCDMPNVVWVDLANLNLDAGAPTLIFDLAADLEASGEVSGKFKPTDPLVFQKAGTVVTWRPAA